MEQKLFHDQAETIRRAYRRIDGDWLRSQYRIMLALAGFTFVMELLIFLVLWGTGDLVTGPARYLLRYVLVPTALDLLLVGAATVLIRVERLPMRVKMYGVSIAIVLMAFVIYTIHAVFSCLYLIFTFPMILTVVYGDRTLTLLTGLMAVISKSVSDLFLVWDPFRSNVLQSQGATSNFAVSLLLLLLFCALCLCLIETEQRKNRASIDLEVERLQYWEEAMTDHLTKVWNRQALHEAFTNVGHRWVEGYYLAMLDIDHFKELNDTYGHQVGDDYLRSLGDVLNQVCGEEAYPFRFGGDEFCILLWDTDEAGARALCGKLRQEFAKVPVQTSCQPVTLSIGLTCMRPDEPPADLLGRADAALYQAKRTRDTVCLCD